MPSYTLSSGETFDTVIIPRGTVLFRGFNMMTNGKKDYDKALTELFGPGIDGSGPCVDPHYNMFFYPTPYVSDAVEPYSIHAIYITNYDVELVNMIQPSRRTRDMPTDIHTSPYVRCRDIYPKDKCGNKMKETDPCLTPLLITEYPNIHGYIALAANDSNKYRRGFLTQTKPPYATQSLPFAASNAKGINGIPEIVLHPYHVRTSLDIRRISEHAYDEGGFAFAMRHRAELNYFPLLYVTEAKTYTFKELDETGAHAAFASTERDDVTYNSRIPDRLFEILEAALSPDGIDIDGVIYTFTIDLRTGFYIAKNHAVPRLSNGRETGVLDVYRQVMDGEYSPNSRFIVPFEYPPRLKKGIHGYLSRMKSTNSRHTEDDVVANLNRLGASFSRHYIFHGSQPTEPTLLYRIETQFPRPELTNSSRRLRTTRRQSTQSQRAKRVSTFKRTSN